MIDATRPRFALSNHGLRHAGGIERYAMTLVRGFHEAGIRPTVIAKRFDTSLPEYGWVDAVPASMRGVPGKLRDLYFDWRIGRIKRRLGLFPLIGCNQTRWSDIGICGGTHPGYLAAMNLRAGWADRLKIDLERAHLSASKTVVAHSQRMHDECVQYYGTDPQKIRLLYPPVDGTRFSPVDDAARRALRARLQLPEDRAVFLLASTGHKRKGLDLLTHFFDRTALPVLLLVAGRPVGGSFRNVRELGYVTDLENVYRAADFTVLASAYEPFGLVGVESVLCGTPVVLGDNAGCAEVIGPQAQLPFSVARPDSLEAAVHAAVSRWQTGEHRLASPAQHLGYDPSVASHIQALLQIVESVAAT